MFRIGWAVVHLSLDQADRAELIALIVPHLRFGEERVSIGEAEIMSKEGDVGHNFVFDEVPHGKEPCLDQFAGFRIDFIGMLFHFARGQPDVFQAHGYNRAVPVPPIMP